MKMEELTLTTVGEIDQHVKYDNEHLDEFDKWVAQNQVGLYQRFLYTGGEQSSDPGAVLEFQVYCLFCYEGEKLRRMFPRKRPTIQ
jgi:hypothetical protein